MCMGVMEGAHNVTGLSDNLKSNRSYAGVMCFLILRLFLPQEQGARCLAMTPFH